MIAQSTVVTSTSIHTFLKGDLLGRFGSGVLIRDVDVLDVVFVLPARNRELILNHSNGNLLGESENSIIE